MAFDTWDQLSCTINEVKYCTQKELYRQARCTPYGIWPGNKEYAYLDHLIFIFGL